MKRKNSDQFDIDVIKRQLNTNTVYVKEIVQRCEHGYPAVVLLDPIFDDGTEKKINYESLSNLIWLTCPFLNAKIHELEDHGYIRRITNFIKNDRTLKKVMKRAHASYYYLRKKIYRGVKSRLNSMEDRIDLLNAGIGGIRETSFLKCLHLHYAHYTICGDNVAGKVVHHLLKGELSCKKVICNNAKD